MGKEIVCFLLEKEEIDRMKFIEKLTGISINKQVELAFKGFAIKPVKVKEPSLKGIELMRYRRKRVGVPISIQLLLEKKGYQIKPMGEEVGKS
jgi:hypothetical protein